MEAILFMVGCAVVVCGVGAAGYFYGRDCERREWLYWLKTVKSSTADEQIRKRFHEKNAAT